MVNRQKILIVDDKKENLYALEMLLKDTGAEVVQAACGNDALIASLNHDFSLAILDVQMPEMDGYELASILRSAEKTSNIPIIFLSAVYSDEHHVFRGYESGAVDFITKPYNPGIFLSKVNVFLHREQLLQELKKEMECRKRVEEEWERTFKTIPDLIAILDREHRVVRVNAAMADHLGLAPEQCIGARCHEIVHGLSIPPEFCPHKLTCRDGEEHVVEIHEAKLGGDFLVSTTPMYDDQEQLIGSIHVARNITERKQMEEELLQKSGRLEAANRELESFSYSISHDLRAPLRAIAGFSRMLLSGRGERLEEETQRKLRVIQDNVQKMEQLIDHLLDFSRLGRTATTPSFLDTNELIDESWQELCDINPGRRMEFRKGYLPPIWGDRTLIRQVITNLLSNAVKFTRTRDRAIIEIGSNRKGSEYQFYVKDNGTGFDMRYYDKLFAVFQRLHTDEEFEGTGVGLAIVQRIIHRHGGRVWAESAVDSGASFYFSLPVAKDKQQ
ncbi:MAG: response regulator [Syntrophales bacterium]|nr:response regulator [Syntrophales bacterium]